MAIKHQERGAIAVPHGMQHCPRCSHRTIYHNQSANMHAGKVSLTSCFVTGCKGCPEYTGDQEGA